MEGLIDSSIQLTFIWFLPGPLHKLFSNLTRTTKTLQTRDTAISNRGEK